jgi:single-strand DNA-binding protein
MSEYKSDNFRTVTGNLTKDPELKFTTDGKAVAEIDIAETIRKKDQDDEVRFWNRITLWESLAENAAESLHKGDRVVCVFYSKPDSYTNKKGEKVDVERHTATALGAELRWASVDITKNPKG